MSNFQTKIKNHYKKLGYNVLKIIKLSDNGYPDLICLKDGIVIFIEVKEEKDTLKPLQINRINELNKNGFIAFCLQKGKGVIFGSDIYKNNFKDW